MCSVVMDREREREREIQQARSIFFAVWESHIEFRRQMVETESAQ